MAPENINPNGEPSDIQQNSDSNDELTETDFIEVIEALIDPDPTLEIENSEYDIIETEGSDMEEDLNNSETLEDDEESFSEEAFQEQMDNAEAEAHAQRATEAQERADADIEAGDYAAAAQERESAEEEAWEAGDGDMPHGSDSVELETAADYQQDAEEFEQQEAEHADAGDYEAARDDAFNAANAMDWADSKAGGPDHTDQAQAEFEKEDWAVWEQDQADENLREAEDYAAVGDLDAAEAHLDYAAQHQEQADIYGHEGRHDGEDAVYEPSSDVAHDTPVGPEEDSYDSGHDSGYDSDYDSYDSE